MIYVHRDSNSLEHMKFLQVWLPGMPAVFFKDTDCTLCQVLHIRMVPFCMLYYNTVDFTVFATSDNCLVGVKIVQQEDDFVKAVA